MEKTKLINVKRKQDIQKIKKGDNIHIWKKTTVYSIPSLSDRKTKLTNTITLLENPNINDEIIQILGRVCSEVGWDREYKANKTLKENVINTLLAEVNDINWIISSSSSSSSRSFSSSSSKSSS